jgi:uncharacterized protein (DUF697 family)
MNQPLFLNIIEKLEGLAARLPASIQRPILHELTPLKELFLLQRAPRFVLLGSSKRPLQEILPALFAFVSSQDQRDTLMEVFRWQSMKVENRGTVDILDARETDEDALANIHEQLKKQPADVFLVVDNGDSVRSPYKGEIETLNMLLEWNERIAPGARIFGVSLYDPHRSKRHTGNTGNEDVAQADPSTRRTRLHTGLAEKRAVRDRLVQVIEIPVATNEIAPESGHFMSLLAQNLPNPARVEMIRISRDLRAQTDVARVLVKSTTAVCTAIGAQPIPFADLPILTGLQLVMVSGIMYLSGRQRSFRAATEFIGAIGANVGAGMVLREGTRAVLKFFPGWGNLVCGVVAGAGTYAIGHAGIAYFVEGVSLRDARQTYLHRRKSRRSRLRATEKRDQIGRN